MKSAEEQYLELCQNVLEKGSWKLNERTGVYTKSIINADLEYSAKDFPILTTKQCYWKSAIAELLGYIRGCDNAAQFRELGTNTWNANANENESWLANKHRNGTDDMGRVYGVQGREWLKPAEYFSNNKEDHALDQLSKIVNDLSNGIDDRGEILTFWNPGEFDLGCLRPCMHTYQFSITDIDVLHVNIFQRSADIALGLPFNMIQGYAMLLLMSRVTGLKMGKVFHKIVNAHIYENQVDGLMTQLTRPPIANIKPKLSLNRDIESLSELETVTVDDFSLSDYTHHGAIKFPFTV